MKKAVPILILILCCMTIVLMLFGLIPNSYAESEINNRKDDPVSSVNYSGSGSSGAFFGPDVGTITAGDINLKNNKAVIIIFDRGYKTQFTNAKPVLDKYGFKASFFIICSFVDGKGYYAHANGKEIFLNFQNAMSWKQIKTLSKEDHDVESHGMQHRYLKNLSSAGLQHEVSKSKECLEDHGLGPTFFQMPFNKGGDNSTILNMVSAPFDFGLSDHSKLMFLNCDGWKNYGFLDPGYEHQEDCRTYSEDGITPTRTNRYSIKEWSHDRLHDKLNDQYPLLGPHGNEISNMLFDEFVKVVQSQSQYNNKVGKIVAIPIISYHSIGMKKPYSTSAELFEREMEYLHDNGFKVLKLTDLEYDYQLNTFYLK